MIVRKKILAEAVQITSPEEERKVRDWLREYTESEEVAESADLEDLKRERFFFLRDEGSTVLYVVHPDVFEAGYEAVEDDPAERFSF